MVSYCSYSLFLTILPAEISYFFQLQVFFLLDNSSYRYEFLITFFHLNCFSIDSNSLLSLTFNGFTL